MSDGDQNDCLYDELVKMATSSNKGLSDERQSDLQREIIDHELDS